VTFKIVRPAKNAYAVFINTAMTLIMVTAMTGKLSQEFTAQ
jgi:hypothetical protein